VRAVLGRKGDYSVRAVLDLASHWDHGRRKAREIAATMDIPETYLGQILANLVRESLLVAVAGPDGGYALAREPDKITLLEVVEASEGPIGLDECVLKGGLCDWESVCPLHVAWSRAQAAFVSELRSTTFADLAEIDSAIAAGTYELPLEAPVHGKASERRGRR
jgi:Rrf2 family protein